jgi:hypothetical protein
MVRAARFGGTGSPAAGSNGVPSQAASLRVSRNASARTWAAQDFRLAAAGGDERLNLSVGICQIWTLSHIQIPVSALRAFETSG